MNSSEIVVTDRAQSSFIVGGAGTNVFLHQDGTNTIRARRLPIGQPYNSHQSSGHNQQTHFSLKAGVGTDGELY